MSCSDAAHCWAVGAAIVSTVNGGASWTTQRVPPPLTPQLDGIACPGKEQCMAVGSDGSPTGAGLVLTTRNGGATWLESPAPAGALVLTSVECSTTSVCLTIDDNGLNTLSVRTTDFGRTWQQGGDLPAGFHSAHHLWCTSGGTCLVAGFVATTAAHGEGAVVRSTDGGQTWATTRVPTGAGVLRDATCRTDAACLAVGTTSTAVSAVVAARGELLVSTDDGREWTTSRAGPPVHDVYGIACPLGRVCAMVGADWVGRPPVATGAVARSGNGGLSFTPTSAAYVPLPLIAVSCPTDGACVAVGDDVLARIALPIPEAKPSTGGRSPSR